MKKFFLAYLKQPPLFQNSKFCAKIRILKFGTKNKCLIWVFWAATLKNIFHIWNQRSWICLIAKYGGKTKILKFVTKNSFFGYFWVEILKSCCYILNDPLQICLISKLFERMEIIKFENKNALFVYFWGRGLKIVVIFEILWVCLVAKFWERTKKFLIKIRDQKYLIWVFLDYNFRILLPYLKSAPSYFSKMSF